MYANTLKACAAITLSSCLVSLAAAEVPGAINPLGMVAPSIVYAQPPYYPAVEPGPDNHHSSTVAEAFYSGLARAIRATGQANLNTAKSMEIREDAYKKHIDNRLHELEIGYQMRELNRQHMQQKRGGRPTPEKLEAQNQANLPRSLGGHELDRVIGTIQWPDAFDYGWFDESRREMERLFVSWAAGEGGYGSRNHNQIVELAQEMDRQIRSNTKQMGAGGVITALNFLRSLKREAKQTATEIAQSRPQFERFGG